MKKKKKLHLFERTNHNSLPVRQRLYNYYDNFSMPLFDLIRDNLRFELPTTGVGVFNIFYKYSVYTLQNNGPDFGCPFDF